MNYVGDPSDLEPTQASPSQPQLNIEEANMLANELREQHRNGTIAFSDAEKIGRMIQGLGDSRGLMRLTFAEGLGAVGSAAVPPLCKALNTHENVTVRRAAAKTLKLIADPASVPSLFKAVIEDPDPLVQASAIGAMVAMGEPAIGNLIDILVYPSATAMQQGLASWGLAFIGAKAPEALRHAAASPNRNIRAAAIAALGEQIQALGDQSARQLVLEALGDCDSDVRAEAATLVGKLNESEWAWPILIPLLKDPESQVRKNSALSLMKLRAIDAIEALKDSINAESDASVKQVLELACNQIISRQQVE